MVTITEYVWSGQYGPFKISSHCEECEITWAILTNMKDNEFKGLEVEIEQKPWLDNWWYCLRRGAYHAPIIMVDGEKFHQYHSDNPIFERSKLVEYVQGKVSK